MSVSKERIRWVDLLKYVCIMFVMLSHLEANTEVLKQFYEPFYLNGFFFVAGYVYYHKRGFKNLMLKKVKGLFLPWLFFSVLNILLSHVLSFNSHMSLTKELMWNFLQIRGKGDGLWFIAALFVTFIPFYFFVDKFENSKKRNIDYYVCGFVALCLSIISNLYSAFFNSDYLPWGTTALPWHIEYVFVAMFWMILGYLYKKKNEDGCYISVSIPIYITVLVIFVLLRYVPFILNASISNRFVNLGYSYVSAFLGVYALACSSKMIKSGKYVQYIGQNTLLCFAFHGKIYSIIQTILKKCAWELYSNVLENVVLSSIFAFAFTIVLSLILILPIYVVNRWFPFLIGRKKKA